MKIVEHYLTNNFCYKAGKTIKPKGLMLHSVGCPQPKAMVFLTNWNRDSIRVCVHAFIDANSGYIYQTLPWNHRAWHCGGSANNTHIGVEMCEPSCIKYTGGSSFTCSDTEKAREMTKRTYESAVELFAYLCKKYDLDPMKDIISHKEGHKRGVASGHGDPEHLWKGLGMEYTMSTFRRAVKDAMDGEKKPQIIVDGLWGSGTTKRLQEIFGTTQDGKISNQHATYKAKNPGLRSGWEWKENPNGKGSSLIRAMQKWAGMTDCDGEIGPKTIKAFQRKLGTTQDGKVSKPSAMVKALQRWANKQ